MTIPESFRDTISDTSRAVGFDRSKPVPGFSYPAYQVDSQPVP